MRFNLLEKLPFDFPLDETDTWLRMVPARQYLKLVEKEEPDLLDWYLLKRIKDKDSDIRFEDAVFTLMYNIKKNGTIEPEDIRETYNYIGDKLFTESRFNFVVNELKGISLGDFIEYFYSQIDEKHPELWNLYKTLLNTELSGMVDPSTNMIRLSINSDELAEHCDRNLDANFIHKLMTDETYELFNFDWTDYSYRDAGYEVRNLSVETEKRILDKFGITKEQLERVVDQDEEIEEELGLDKVDAIANALSAALASGEESGSIGAAERDFADAINSLLLDGAQLVNGIDDPITIDIPKRVFLSDDMAEHLLNTSTTHGFNQDNLKEALLENFEFEEPYYGWQDFDQEAFEEELEFRLGDDL